MNVKINAGAKILDGLRDALSGNFSAATIEGQRWFRASEWKSIETAPRDGTNVLLVDADDPPMIVIAFWQHRDWLVAWDHNTFSEPTHWMPLPKPPVQP